jgi:hypothetical protein
MTRRAVSVRRCPRWVLDPELEAIGGRGSLSMVAATNGEIQIEPLGRGEVIDIGDEQELAVRG